MEIALIISEELRFSEGVAHTILTFRNRNALLALAYSALGTVTAGEAGIGYNGTIISV